MAKTPKRDAPGVRNITDLKFQKGTTYQLSPMPLAIPDNDSTGADATFTVSDVSSPIAKVIVNIGYMYAFGLETIIEIIHPDGTTVRIWNRHFGGARTTWSTVTYDDDATVTITGSGPYSGAYRPTNPLSAFNGKSANGKWIFRVSDLGSGDNGQAVDASITIITANPGTLAWDGNSLLAIGNSGVYIRTASNRGTTGATGIQGATGLQGSTGANAVGIGTTGFAGAAGVQGLTGQLGLAGAAGITGAAGVTGPRGPTGTLGATGPQGATGLASTGGVTGLRGATGIGGGAAGVRGITGVQGITGANTTGVIGVTGALGPNGQTGATGVQGSAGAAGISGFKGITGFSLATGASGITGPDGITGLPATGSLGPTGMQGITGEPGITGQEGITGFSGITGLQGITGAPGPTGQLGATGALGETGYAVNTDTGPIGILGSRGLTGSTYQTGASGLTGPAFFAQVGATGLSATGPQGATGISVGSQGATGLLGAKHPGSGSQGVTGYQARPTVLVAVPKTGDYSSAPSPAMQATLPWGENYIQTRKQFNTNTFGGSTTYNYISWAPNGRYIAVSDSTTTWIVMMARWGSNAYSWESSDVGVFTETLPSNGRSWNTKPIWSPDGSYVVTTNELGEACFYKRINGSWSFVNLVDGIPLCWSPNSELLICKTAQAPHLWAYRVNGFTITRLSAFSSAPTDTNIYDAKYASNGLHLAVISYNGISIYKRTGLDTFTKLTDPSPSTAYGTGCAWSPDSKFLAVTDGGSSNDRLIIYSRSGDSFTALSPPTGKPASGNYTQCVTWHPSGDYVAFGTYNSPYIVIYKRSGDSFAPTAQGIDLNPPAELQANSIAWSPDGQCLVIAPYAKGLYAYVTGESFSHGSAVLSAKKILLGE